jgi:DNA-dependent RNA polymerase auxiliary subunit epsilon
MYQYYIELEAFNPRFYSYEIEESDYKPTKVALYVNAESEAQVREMMPNTRITLIALVKDQNGKPLKLKKRVA